MFPNSSLAGNGSDSMGSGCGGSATTSRGKCDACDKIGDTGCTPHATRRPAGRSPVQAVRGRPVAGSTVLALGRNSALTIITLQKT